MNRSAWVFGSVAVLAGCSVETAATGEATSESIAVTQEAIEAFHFTTDLETQSVKFWGPAGTQWVDVHLRINGGAAINVRMVQQSDYFRAGPLVLRPGDKLSYSFTYFAGGVATDTLPADNVIPLTFQPNYLRPEVRGVSTNNYDVRLATATPLGWADIHYSKNGGPQLNVRMSADPYGTLHGPNVQLVAGDTLRYWVTYQAGSFVFDSEPRDFVASAVLEPRRWLNEAGFQSSLTAPYQFSKTYSSDATAGWRFAGNAPQIPIERRYIGPYGEYPLDTLKVAFEYAGTNTPRSGTAVALVPASAANPGWAPANEADAARGKAISFDTVLRASYLTGGDGISVALVDVNGMWTKKVPVSQYRSDYCRYGCALAVPVSDFLGVGSSWVDLNQVRYIAFVVEGDPAVTTPSLNITGINFRESLY